MKCSHPDLAPIYCPSKWLVNQWGCQVWECHDTTTEPPITTPDPPPVPSDGTGENLGAEIGFSFLGILLVLLFGLGIFCLCKYWGGRVSRFMREQTSPRSIQWRVDFARARVLRAQFRDFFNRSLARFETARLEESTDDGISEYADLPNPSLWTRIRSGIQTPFAARESSSLETPRRHGVTRPTRNIYAENPTASNSTSRPQNSGIRLTPPDSMRNSCSTRRGRSDECILSFENNHRYETIRLDSFPNSNDGRHSDEDDLTAWTTAMGASIGDPSVVRVSFNPNDQDSVVVLERTGVNGHAGDNNSSNVATGSNLATNHTSQVTDASNDSVGMQATFNRLGRYLYCELQNVREVFTGTKKRTISLEQESTDNASVAASVDSSVPSSLFPSQFLEQHMSVGSTLEVGSDSELPESFGSTNPFISPNPFTSPGSPRATSSPYGSFSSASSDGDNNVTVQEMPDGQPLVEQAVPDEMASLSAKQGEAEMQNLAVLMQQAFNPAINPPQLQNSIPAADAELQNSNPAAPALSPVRPAPSPPPGDLGAIPKQPRQKKVWPPKSSPYNLRNRKDKD